MSTEGLSFLFRTYIPSFYGVETWYGALGQSDFHKIGDFYHCAVKKTVGLKNW